MTEQPSTRAILWVAARTAVGFVLAWLVLNPLLFHGREDLTWAIVTGCSSAEVNVLWLYIRKKWRTAVAPEHMLGLGGAGLALFITVITGMPDSGVRSGGFRVAAGALILAPTVCLMLLSLWELWSRRPVAGGS